MRFRDCLNIFLVLGNYSWFFVEQFPVKRALADPSASVARDVTEMRILMQVLASQGISSLRLENLEAHPLPLMDPIPL